MRTVVLIPALNEEASIGHVVRAIPREHESTIIVVDNGSSDRTVSVARSAGAIVVTEDQRGYGRACLRGLATAATFKPDTIVFLDGDFSDKPEEMTSILAPLEDGSADFVIGSRTTGSRDPGALLPHAILGNAVACMLIRAIWGVRFTDLGPFRAIRYHSLLALNMKDENFGWTVEMQIKAARLGVRCREVPVSYRKRIGKSKVSGTFAGTLKASFVILKTILYEALDGQSTNLFDQLALPEDDETGT